MASTTAPFVPELNVLKALGDDTRYGIYQALAAAAGPLSAAEVATAVGLHVNTVRPQMERLREVGLLEVTAEHRGGPGRPQHLYALVERRAGPVPESSGPGDSTLTVLVGALERAGFDPVVDLADDDAVTVEFGACPYRSLAEAHPDVVCALHRSLVEGVVGTTGGVVVGFGTVVDRAPCRVQVRGR